MLRFLNRVVFFYLTNPGLGRALFEFNLCSVVQPSVGTISGRLLFSKFPRQTGVCIFPVSPLQENIFTCQSKIYSYVNPGKTSTSRPPLQEENSATHPEAKGQTCKLETCQKLEGNNKFLSRGFGCATRLLCNWGCLHAKMMAWECCFNLSEEEKWYCSRHIHKLEGICLCFFILTNCIKDTGESPISGFLEEC